MNSYRPQRFSGLGAHVSGLSAFVVVAILERAEASDSIKNLPPGRRAEVQATLDTLRAAASHWIEHEKGNKADVVTDIGSAAPEAGRVKRDERIPAWRAAELLELTERRVTQLATSGALDGTKVRGKWMITASSVQNYRLAKDLDKSA